MALTVFAAPSAAQDGEIFATIVDDQGPDQLDKSSDSGNSQQDLTGARIGSEGSFGWAWDETDLSGNNSIDTCTYFQEPDETVVSVCYSVQFEADGTVTEGFPQFALYDCGTTFDPAQRKCTGNNQITDAYTLTCTEPTVVPSYFTPDDQPDLQAECKLTNPDGTAPELLLLNTCTKTSASPSSNSNDCLFSAAPAFIQLEKVVDGGDAAPSDFTLTAENGGIVTGAGPTVPLAPIPTGTITLSEDTTVENYRLSSLICTFSDGSVVDATNSGSIVLGDFDQVTCVFTNEPETGDLVIEKTVVNDNGGTAKITDFGIFTTASGLTFDDGVTTDDTTVYTATLTDVVADDYGLGEFDLPGYDEGLWSCTTSEGEASGGGESDDATVTVVAGDTVTCSISNDDAAPLLILEKTVITDNGGTAVASDWTLTADGYDAEAPQAGDYTLSESGGPDGYSLTSLSCDDDSGTSVDSPTVNLALGETVTCTFVNDDDGTSLTLVKDVVNDNGGTASASAFDLSAGDNTVTGSEDGAVAATSAGTYALSESSLAGYTKTSITCDNDPGTEVTEIALALGDDVTCTFVNDDDPASLILAKTVTNDSGGEAPASAFTLIAADDEYSYSVAGSTDGAEATDQAGAYDLSESGPGGYTNTSLTCDNDPGVDVTEVTVGLGETVTCTFVNDDNAGSLSLVKQVNNDFGGTAEAGDFTLVAVDYDPADPQAGTYELSESGPAGYELDSLTCSNSGDAQVDEVTIALGETVTCTFVNSDIAPKLRLVKNVINDSGTALDADQWTLTASKDGTEALAGDGEATGDELMAGTYTLAESSTNPAAADYTWTSLVCNGIDVTESAQIDLEIGDDVTCVFTNTFREDGDIKIVKTPETQSVISGGTAEFTLTVTNEGNVPLSNVVVSDPDCDATPAYQSGDDGDGVLQAGEIWVYTCSAADVTAGFTNTATVEAETPVGLQVDDDDTAEVTVLVPGVKLDKGWELTAEGDLDGDGKVELGDTVTYTLVATNTGETELTKVEISDDLDGLSALDCDPAQPATLAIGAKLTCTATYTIDADDVAAGQVDNTATASSDQTGNAEASATVPVGSNPKIDLDKSVDPTTARLGDEITYTFVVTNDGDVDLTGVTVTDPLEGLSAIDCGDFDGTLAVGASVTCTATYTVTVDDVRAGEVVNTATAGSNETGPVTSQASVTVLNDFVGCTLTQGYWRTHAGLKQNPGKGNKNRGNGRGPAADPTWHAVGGPDADFFGAGTYYDVLWASPEGDAFYILAQQYIAAELNIANGATSIDAVVEYGLMAEAEALLSDGEITDDERARAIELSELLDAYNNGEIGPGHCDD